MPIFAPLLLALALLASPPFAAAALAGEIPAAESAVSEAAGAFVPGTEDVPLMPGLTPLQEGGLVFDKPEGRIVQASAEGAVTRQAVRKFYRASLASLGWMPEGADQWGREGERLKVDFHGRDGKLTVAFTLSPEPQAAH